LRVSAYIAASYTANRFVYFPKKYPDGHWIAQPLLHAARPHPCLVGSERYTRLAEIAAAGSLVLALDYSGYGKSEGRPTERGLYRDADAAYDYLLKSGYGPDQIVIHGESLGTAVAVDLAARRPCAGVILEAPFTSGKDVAEALAPVIGRMPIWGFDSRSKVGRIHAPILVIHGIATK
jgi:fermentation-respiration switch protein FrsA (DUF1100 family)